MSAAFSPDELRLLSAMLRARPGTPEELGRTAVLSGARFDEAFAGLVDQGFVTVVEGGLQIASVESALLARLEAFVAEQHAGWESIGARLARLPGSSREWGRTNLDPVPTELVHATGSAHGVHDQWGIWMRLMTGDPPHAPIAVFPDALALAAFVHRHLDDVRRSTEQGGGIRCLVRAGEVPAVRAAGLLGVFVDAGIAVRTMPEVPGWLYVDGGVLAALPSPWGVANPSSVAVVREPALVAPLAEYGERLWSQAHPLPQDSDGRDAVLGLLADGLSDGAVATALGMSVRTVRRRIAEAAAAYGVGTRFELGVEWARRS